MSAARYSWTRCLAASLSVLMMMVAACAEAALPVSGAAFHVDASATSTLTTETVNGTNFVTRWNDASGGSRYATSDAGFRPWIDYEDGLPFVDFGPGRYARNEKTGYAPTGFLKWSSNDTSIREIFLVFSDYPLKSGSFLLSHGSEGSYHFHRGGKALFNTTYASKNIVNGLIEVDGASVAADYQLPEGFHIIHLRTTGTVPANRFASDRDNYQQGAQRLREVIIYDKTLTTAEATETYDYLHEKWFFRTDCLDIEGDPDVGSSTPAYGRHLDIAAGATIACSAPASWKNESGDVAATCAGWKLYDSSGSVVDQNTGRSFTYTHPNPAAYRRLVWQWEIKYRVTASVKGGTVTNAEDWLSAGSTFNTLAVPTDSSNAFHRWRDGAGTVVGETAALALTVTGPTTLAGDFCGVPKLQCEMTVSGYSGSSVLTDFPVLVRVSTGISGFSYSDCAADGSDLSFTTESGEILPHEIDTWNASGTSLVWVRLPTLTGTTTKFLMRWKDAYPPENDPTEVWGEYVGVWHLGEADAGTNTNAVDSTGHGFTATIPNKSETEQCETAAAKIGNGRWKPKTTMTVPNYNSQNVGGTFTASGWFCMEERTGYESFFSRKQAWNTGTGWMVHMQNDNVKAFCTGSNATTANPSFSSSVVNRWIFLTAVYDGANLKLYENATKFHDGAIVAAGDNGYPLYVGGSIRGTIDEIRLRKAASSADRVKAEYEQVATAAFVTAGAAEVPPSACISVLANRLERGTVTPTYGSTENPEAKECVFTAESETILNGGLEKAVCTGWRIVNLANGKTIRTSAEAGTGEGALTCRHTYVAGTRIGIEWQFDYYHKVTVLTRGTGTVSDAGGWVEDGETFESTATGSGTMTFRLWQDGTGKTVSSSATYSATISAALTLYACFSDPKSRCYVTTNVANTAVFPYDTWATAAHTLQAALAVGTEEIEVGEGTYVNTESWYTFNRAVKIFSEKGPTNTILQTMSNQHQFTMTHEGVLLAGFTLKDGRGRYTDSLVPVVNMSAGVVSNCIFTGSIGMAYAKCWYLCGSARICDTEFNGSGFGSNSQTDCTTAFLWLEGNALVERCSIHNWVWAGGTYGTDYKSAVVLNSSGATLRNSLVYANQNGTSGQDASNYLSGGARLNNGTIENCTFSGNYTANYGGGIAAPNATGKIVNCIVYGNDCRKDYGKDIYAPKLPAENISYVCSPDIENTDAIPNGVGGGCTSVDPKFSGEAPRKYELTVYSVGCIDKATNTVACQAENAKDILGNPRLDWKNGLPDIGCYEFVPSKVKVPLSASFDVSAGEDLGETDVKFTAMVAGDDLTGLVYTWTLTDSLNKVTTIVTNETPITVRVGTGQYAVELKVTNTSGETATVSEENVFSVSPKDIYVSTNGSGTYPYSSYASGTNSLQTALDAASNGSIIHVNDGDYKLADTLKIAKQVTFVSENGPSVTRIYGWVKSQNAPLVLLDNAKGVLSGLNISGIHPDGSQPQQYGGLRVTLVGGLVTNCWIVGNKTVNISVHGSGARLEGGTMVDCLVSNNWTKCSGGAGMYGGGLYVTGGSVLVDRCRIIGNRVTEGATSYGGGVFLNNGIVRNCLIANNTSQNYGGGATRWGGSLVNCTVVNNTAGSGNGGIDGASVDCLVYNNSANGVKQDVDDPGFVNAAGGDFHLSSASPAIDAGTSASAGDLDLDRKPRVSGSAADKGCYEFDQSQFSVGIVFKKLGGSFAPMDVEFRAEVFPSSASLDASKTWWTFDGTEPSSENHGAVGTCVTNNLGPGRYTVRFKTVYKDETIAVDKENWLLLYGETVYLVEKNPNATPPYTTWETAATTLDNAFAYAIAGSTIIVSNGTYNVTGTYDIYRKLTVKSLNGPSVTMFNANGGDRRFNIGHAEAVVSGIRFHGASKWDKGFIYLTSGLVTNCSVTSCYTMNYGGAGVYMTGGTVVDTLFDSNSCGYTGGQCGTHLRISGSAAVVDRCTFRSAYVAGATQKGAVYVESGTLRNSIVRHNKLTECSGVIVGSGGVVENCTIVTNTATSVCSGVGVTASKGARVRNTIVWGNRDSAKTEANAAGAGTYECCSTNGVNPRFRNVAKNDWRIRVGSPCVNAGMKLDWMTEGARDYLGQPRVIGPCPDIGCCENQSGGLMLIVR